MAWMRSHFLNFLLALQFFSRLPVTVNVYTPERQGKILNYLPLVGLLFGGLLSAMVVFWGWQSVLSPNEAAFVLLVFWIWFSGALHLDGVADSADAALGAPGLAGTAGSAEQRQRAQKILHDSRIGTGGAVALVLTLLGKWVFLAGFLSLAFAQAMSDAWLYLVAFFFIPFIARLVPLVLVKTCASATESAGHKKVFSGLRSTALWGYLMVFLLVVLVFIYLQKFAISIALVGSFVLAWRFVQNFAKRLLAGINGDLLGLSIEVSELLLLLALVGALRLA